MTDAVLEAQGLRKSFGTRRVVDDVRIRVGRGEIVGLLGPNGAGKTTTFRMLMGLLRPDAGTVVLDGRDITGEPVHRRARLGLGYLAQEPSVFRTMSVLDNVVSVLEWMPDDGGDRKERARALLGELGIERLADRDAGSLSGGERRRLELCRVLALDPKVILLDEPFSGVDPRAVEEIQTLMHAMKARGIGMVLTDHNAHETLAITDRTYILVGGTIAAEGTPKTLAADPAVRRAYLGESFVLKDHAASSAPPSPGA